MEMNMTQHWIRMCWEPLTISLPGVWNVPRGFLLFVSCLSLFSGGFGELGLRVECLRIRNEAVYREQMLRVCSRTESGWSHVAAGSECRFMPGLMLRVLVSVSADGKSLADFALSYRAPFFHAANLLFSPTECNWGIWFSRLCRDRYQVSRWL